MSRALGTDFLKNRLMKFGRPRGASPSLGLGLGGAPRNEKAKSAAAGLLLNSRMR